MTENEVYRAMSAPPAVTVGSRIVIDTISKTDQAYIPLSPGDEGEVVGGNGAQLWVRFDKGVDVTVLPGVDRYSVLAAPVKTTKKAAKKAAA